MAFHNTGVETFTLTGHDNKEYTYDFQANSMLFSDDGYLVSFTLNGKHYFYKSNGHTHSAAADVVKNAGKIALAGAAGAAAGRTGIIAAVSAMTVYEIQNHYTNHTQSGYYNNGHFMYYGPVKW